MLEFKQNDTSATVILTLTELVSIPGANYLFVFTHVTTKATVVFVKLVTDDTSPYPIRHNDFLINPSVLFAGTDVGEWHYVVYEQASAVNTDPLQAGGAIEFGKMYLNRSADFAYTMYNSETDYKTYNG